MDKLEQMIELALDEAFQKLTPEERAAKLKACLRILGRGQVVSQECIDEIRDKTDPTAWDAAEKAWRSGGVSFRATLERLADKAGVTLKFKTDAVNR